MITNEALGRRIKIAVAEAKDADRVWRTAIAAADAETMNDPEARKGLDALWQERERAFSRVIELRCIQHAVSRRQSVGLATRLRGVRRSLSLLRHTSTLWRSEQEGYRRRVTLGPHIPERTV